jgi:organic hydroperoxide reductase OsmC/OhrA
MPKSCTTIDLEAFDQTKAAVAADPSAGQGSFKSTTVWEDGARARTTARTFSLETDEPAPLGGTDQNIDPMELLLAAVGTCLTIGWVTNADPEVLEEIRAEAQVGSPMLDNVANATPLNGVVESVSSQPA